MKKVEQVLTLSLYHRGRHVFEEPKEEDVYIEPSFAESLSPLSFMIRALYEMQVPLGSKIKITMETVPEDTK